MGFRVQPRLDGSCGVLPVVLSKSLPQFPYKSRAFTFGLDGFRSLDLRSNLLEDPLQFPTSINITYMSFLENHLTGGIPLSVCSMSSSRILDLSDNLNGEIPNCLGSFSRDLELINLRNNGLYGAIPQTLTKANTLKTLDLSHNRLNDLLPRSLANCTKLEVLNLGYNMIDDSFPFWLETLPLLEVLILRSNCFRSISSGPRSTQAFANWSIVNLSPNEFSGSLPSKYFETWNLMMVGNIIISRLTYDSSYISGFLLSYCVVLVTVKNKGLVIELVSTLTVFKAVDFSDNVFMGNIPGPIGDLKALHVLNLSGNGPTKPIPSLLGNLRELESLVLTRNKLLGEIP